MLITVAEQIRLIVFSLLAGMLTGSLFDIYRLIRGFNNPNKYITFFEDVLFWILGSILVFLFLLYTDYAYVSIYIYLIILLGIILYMRLLSGVLIILVSTVILFISRIFRIICKASVFPIEYFIYKFKTGTRKKWWNLLLYYFIYWMDV